jgi:hypothetical protein
MKQLLIILAMSLFGCTVVQPTYTRVNAQYVGYFKENNLYVMKFWAKRYDTLYVEQHIKPRFHYREYVILQWTCDSSNGRHDVKILKSR